MLARPGDSSLKQPLPIHRICPGRHLAEQSLFIMIASILSAFSIAPPVDEHGKSVPCKLDMSSGPGSYVTLELCNTAILKLNFQTSCAVRVHRRASLATCDRSYQPVTSSSRNMMTAVGADL